MAFEIREGGGFLFKNDRKREGKNDADFNGSIKLNGEEFWLNGWTKNGGKGPFLSLSLRPKNDCSNGHASADSFLGSGAKDIPDDEIPF